MTANRPQPRPGVLDIAPYVPGKSTAPGVAKVFKLSSNETPLGPSPNAIAAYRAVGEHLEDYPDGSASALREAIGAAFGLDPDRIVCGAGSDDLLNLLARAYLGDGDEAIYTTHGFLVYPIAAMGTGAKAVAVPETKFTANVDAILKAVTPKTRIIFLANPNNPTGTYLPFDEVKRLHSGLPAHVLLVLDAAYAEYVQRNDYKSGIELVATTDNVVMTRTFSKIYGLAALRLGWMYGPAHVVDAINRIRGPFNVNAPAIAAGIAAIRDTAHVDRARAHNSRWLAWLTEEIGKLGLAVTPSAANFVLIHFPETKGKTAKEADAFLTKRGLILRQVGAYKLPNALRMSVGTEEANRLVVAGAQGIRGKSEHEQAGAFVQSPGSDRCRPYRLIDRACGPRPGCGAHNRGDRTLAEDAPAGCRTWHCGSGGRNERRCSRRRRPGYRLHSGWRVRRSGQGDWPASFRRCHRLRCRLGQRRSRARYGAAICRKPCISFRHTLSPAPSIPALMPALPNFSSTGGASSRRRTGRTRMRLRNSRHFGACSAATWK